MKKKVLHIIHNAGAGGAQVLLLDLFQQWSSAAIELILVTHLEGHYVADYKATGHKLYTIDFERSSFSVVQALRKIIAKEKPDYIHNHLWKACLLGSLASLSSGVRLYNQIHNVLFDTNRPAWKLFIYRRLLYLFRRTNCCFICVSQYEINSLQKLGFKEDQLHVVYNGVRPDKFEFKPLPYTGKTPLKLLFVGRLNMQKGIIYLLKSISALTTSTYELTIVGDGELRDELEFFCTEKQLTNVHFLGFVKDIKPLLTQHHVFVAPSLWEVFGISIAEAMAMGKAVVSSRVGGVPELIIEGEGGYLCPPADVDGLCEAIQKLQEQPEKIAAFGRFNRARLEANFSFQQTLHSFEELYL